MRAEFDAAKAQGLFPMGQVPVLVSTAGGKPTTVCQSKAIARYLASKTGLLGASAEEAADIDSVCEAIVDLQQASGNASDDAKREAFLREKLPTTLATLEKLLGSGFAVGGKLSQADVFLYHLATWFFEPTPWTTEAAKPTNASAKALVHASPKVAAIVAAVKALPGVAAHEAGRAARGEAF